MLRSALLTSIERPARHTQITIEIAALACLTTRGFLPWRLSDAGPGACGIVAMGRHPKPLYGASVVKHPFFWPSASGKVRLFARAGPSLRPAAANPPFFCSTAPQAFFRPDRGLPPPARADDVKAGRAAATEGSAF